MNISNLKVNHIEQPLGYNLDQLSLSYIVESENSTYQKFARIEISENILFDSLIYDSGMSQKINPLSTNIKIKLKPRTRYHWRVTVIDDNGESKSETSWFETSKLNETWDAQWITSNNKDLESIILSKLITVTNVDNIESVRGYFCGLGLYELYVNQKKVTDELFNPGLNAYDKWLQYQTFDLTKLITQSDNQIEILLGNGWYKGRFGFNHGGKENHYGDQLGAIGEIFICYKSGATIKYTTDQDWQYSISNVVKNSIYDGEIYDHRVQKSYFPVCTNSVDFLSLMQDRRSIPVTIQKYIDPVSIKKLNDSYIIDFGENIVGWIEFQANEPADNIITIKHAEIMQNDDIYIDNLRTAQATYQFISNGKKLHCRPHFSFYGFRYIKVSGLIREVNQYHFKAAIISSNNKRKSYIETSNPLVNQFFENVMRSQQGNFLEIPTDCPQRDERLGWTGDLQVFSSAACFNMDCYAFLSKYLFDLSIEQKKHNGAVPFVIPTFDVTEAGSSAWGDAATIVPWNIYKHSGDLSILKQQYRSMQDWVNYILTQVESNNSEDYLWNSGFHFGDWLALDNEPYIHSPKGKTDDKFVASCYFYWSLKILNQTAALLDKHVDSETYSLLSEKVKTSIQNEYISPNGKIAIDTQTAFVLSIMLDIYEDHQKKKVKTEFLNKLKRDQFKIKTGFVGTPFICHALTKIGLNDIAYKIFLNTEQPSWLCAVTQGATTIWERWDSLSIDGTPHPDEMNSFNHYALGSSIDWLYQCVFGLQIEKSSAGFHNAYIKPEPNYQLQKAKLVTDTASGQYVISWEILDTGKLCFYFTIPFNCKACIELPDIADKHKLENIDHSGLELYSHKKNLKIIIGSGNYTFLYMPDIDYLPSYSIKDDIKNLLSHEKCKEVLDRIMPDVTKLPFISMFENEDLIAISKKSFFKYNSIVLDEIENELSSIKKNM